MLPAPLVGGPKDSYVTGDSLTLAQQSENGLPSDYYQYLISGGTGQTSKTPDMRITNVDALPPGPFQLTTAHLHLRLLRRQPGPPLLPDVAAARLQRSSTPPRATLAAATQICSPGSKSPSAPAPTAARSRPTSAPTIPDARTTGEGSTAMGFYNVQQGDAPYFKHSPTTTR